MNRWANGLSCSDATKYSRIMVGIANRTRTQGHQKKLANLIVILVLLSLGACQSKTPPGSDVFSNTVNEAGCTFLVWQEGLRLMLWTDITGESGTNSATSSGDPMFRQTGYAQAADGRRVEWQLETADGRTATLTIGDQRFDPAQGALFLIATAQGNLQIQQLQYDFDPLRPDPSSCENVATNSPEVQRFIAPG
jgi:hypothetical protein